MWKCSECNGTNVSALVWADPNTLKLSGPGEDVDYNNKHNKENCLCSDCDKGVTLTWKEENNV